MNGLGKMPTDVAALLARKKNGLALARNDAKLILVVYAFGMLVIEMLFASHSFEHAMILVGSYG
jgi:hypothetical protein